MNVGGTHRPSLILKLILAAAYLHCSCVSVDGAVLRAHRRSGHRRNFVSFPLRRGDERLADVASPHVRTSLVQLGSAAAAKANPPIRRKDFFLPVTVGFPPQKFLVTLDTCSGNLVLPTAHCRSTACEMHRRYNRFLSMTASDVHRMDETELSSTNNSTHADREVLSLYFGRGRASGHIVADTVCVGEDGSLCAKNTYFLAADEETRTPFAALPYDGILGLGLPATSVSLRFNFLGNLADSKYLSADRFALWLALAQDDEPSEVTLGDFNPARLASNVVWTKVDDYESGYWQIKGEMTIDNKSLGLGQLDMAIDTGTSVIAGPQALIDALDETLNLQTDCGNFGSLPLLGFKFGGTILNLEPTDYVCKSADGTTCSLHMAAIDLPHGIILLGDPFLFKYYSIFDRDTLQVGFALAHHKPNMENPSLPLEKLVIRA